MFFSIEKKGYCHTMPPRIAGNIVAAKPRELANIGRRDRRNRFNP
jgi:hypothetical protein